MPCVCLVLYFGLHVWSSRWFAESEFWIVLGKLVDHCRPKTTTLMMVLIRFPGKITLMILLFMFTFITMVGGNPIKDAYGFRYWKDPGPISNYYGDGKSGELRAFLAAI